MAVSVSISIMLRQEYGGVTTHIFPMARSELDTCLGDYVVHFVVIEIKNAFIPCIESMRRHFLCQHGVQHVQINI
jgi:hypothetical protein